MAKLTDEEQKKIDELLKAMTNDWEDRVQAYIRIMEQGYRTIIRFHAAALAYEYRASLNPLLSSVEFRN